jgi:hypothetical protein
MELQNITYEDARDKLTDDQLDKYYGAFVNTNFDKEIVNFQRFVLSNTLKSL